MNAGRFDEHNSANVAFGTTVELIRIPVPGNVRAVLTAFANYVGQTAALGNIVWTLKINGIAIPPLDGTLDIVGDQAQPWPIEDDRMQAPGASVVTVEAKNNSATTNYEAGARLVGRFER